jgi:hypothetical protein
MQISIDVNSDCTPNRDCERNGEIDRASLGPSIKAHMAILKRERAVEIVTASGTQRVTVNPKPAWLCAAVIQQTFFVIASSVKDHSW